MMKRKKGGEKHDSGKLRYDLLSHIALQGTTRVLMWGAVKYGENNWRRGISYSRLFAAMMRHAWAWWGGEDLDPESGLSHLDHVACNVMFLQEMGKEHDDRWRD